MDHSMASGFKPGLGSAVWSPDLTPMSEPEYIGALIGLFILSIGFRALVAAQGYLEAYLHLHYYPRPSSHSSSSSRGQSSSSYQQQQKQLLNPAGNAMGGDSDDDEEGHGRQQQQQQHLGGSDGTGVARPFSSLPHAEKNDPLLLQQGQGVHQPHQQQTSSNTPSRRHKHYGNQLHHHSPPPFYAHETSTPSSLPFLTFPTAQPFIWQAEISRALLTTAVIGIGYMLMLVIMTYNSAYLGVILAGVFVGEVYFARWGRVRPVFPSTPDAGRPSRPMEIKQPQQSSEGTTSGATVSRTAALSTTSLSSSASSHGYSTAMAHHGLSGDGSC
ncbi:MAG: Ctr copper transporter family-domain-containing protein [Linnemannia gamsii]|nr:MAG: Ctr copper transporter family-domain-containing protein [Linnemannia gamsii]